MSRRNICFSSNTQMIMFISTAFKLTSEFIEVMDGVNSHTFIKFRELCYKTFIELRKNCFQITLLVQMLIEGNEDLDCFRERPHAAVQGLQERLRLDLNDRACQEYVNKLINDSIGNWTTTCYDRYQRCFVGVM
jgi:phosphatidylinositol kinase/protein kinase (PI-3  family)